MVCFCVAYMKNIIPILARYLGSFFSRLQHMNTLRFTTAPEKARCMYF